MTSHHGSDLSIDCKMPERLASNSFILRSMLAAKTKNEEYNGVSVVFQ